MKYRSFLFTLLLFSFISCKHEKEKIMLVSTTSDSKWTETKVEVSQKESSENSFAIKIFPDKEQQTIDGFGACFNELGWEALNSVSTEKRNIILESLFDTITGCKFNLCRMPIGANDYAVDWYSFDETDKDFEMKNFSIERDKTRLIPYIKEAQKYNPKLKIWGSPWCPPSWMKQNKHYACKSAPVNDLPENAQGEEMKTQFIMEKEYLSAYANYFVKYIHAYAEEGIEISAIHVQNELNSCQNFPSCIWYPNDMAIFIGDYLGPEFEKQNVTTEIWLGTVERPNVERVDSILLHESAKKYIKGVGFQWAGRGAIAKVHKKYPEMRLMQTETECGNGSNDWAAAEHTWGLMKHYFANGANAYMYWNMILNETGKSQWGWKQNSMITIDSKTKKVVYNPEFYLMKHFSAFVEPGSVKIESSDENCIAFAKANKITIVYYNEGDESEKQFNIGKKTFSLKLKKKSFNTFVLEI